MENSKTISDGFAILRNTLALYIGKELEQEFGSNTWWSEGVIKMLRDDQKHNLPMQGDFSTLTDSLDILNCLTLFADVHWKEVFRKKLPIDCRNWAKELFGVRNKHAHSGGKDFPDDYTWRALDTMSRLCDPIDSKSAEEIRGLRPESPYSTAKDPTTIPESPTAPTTSTKDKTDGILKNTPIGGLPSWRTIIKPHRDVAQGIYKNAEFAADLAQVACGEGSVEYRDPVKFFARTYVTEGMTGLLEQALRRVTGKDGDPVIQLKTAFGGGKTHSMLALYHMMSGRVPVDKIPNIKPVLEKAGVSDLPKANVAVIVGTALNPTESKRPQNMPGITINTLWGEIAAQLAESKNNPKLYDYVKEADKKGVSPGSAVLKNLFDAASPCLILMDELVAYAKKLYGANDLPAGTFDNFTVFIQEVTDATRASKNSLVVASIPESDIEIGGDAGKIALATIEKTFGRMSSIWKPVAANEGFEVVRRRLFRDCKDLEGRDKVCDKFSQMYYENKSDFPQEASEVEYRDKMVSCYPIHPEVFDRLYEDWSTLEGFQRTRGVLRLMAAVIHSLWMGNDTRLMIMPGSIPLDDPNVRDELTRYLPPQWNAIVDSDVDGKHSIPYQKDQSNQRYGSKLATRRVARTIMLGSAPTSRAQNARGIESSHIRLGVVQPEENIADFNDALSSIASSLAYLYANPSEDRFWYDTHPTLRKTVEDRATRISASDVEHEIETRLSSLRNEQPFGGIHICPSSSLDVPDEQSARLVVLRPTDEYKNSNQNTAMTAVTDILNNRGKALRIYRNMLAFIAPDQDQMISLKKAVQLYLAWKSIKADSGSESLNLDATQNLETENNLKHNNETVDMQIKEAYCWLLVPNIDKDTDIKTIVWDTIRISGGNDSIISKAAQKMIQKEQIITEWAPELLLRELDNVLWKDTDNIAINELWKYLCSYCYLPRLANYDVLNKAIQTGLKSDHDFAFASGFDGTHYIDLKFNQSVDNVDRSGYLVKVNVAKKQLAKEGEGVDVGEKPTPPGRPPKTIGEPPVPLPPVAPKKRFFMSADIDSTRINRDIQKCVEEIIQNLTSVDGAKVKISLEVEAKTDDGFTQETVRTITENCQELGVRDSGFEE